MAWGVCQRCGFRYDLAKIKTEWTNLKTCPECMDSRPADLTPPRIGPEGTALGLPPEGTGVEYGRPFDDTFFDSVLFDASGGVSEADL